MAAEIGRKQIENGFSYSEYRALIDKLLTQGKTTGDNHSEMMVDITKLNVHRMKRLDKTVDLIPELTETLNKMSVNMIWIVLTEGWCGDAAQNLPVIAKIADASSNIRLRLLLRDENPDVMDAYLTNGGRAIPKLICLDTESLEELAVWGPRPAPAQKMAQQYKADPSQPKEEFHKRLHLWYAKDNGTALQKEFQAWLNNISR